MDDESLKNVFIHLLKNEQSIEVNILFGQQVEYSHFFVYYINCKSKAPINMLKIWVPRKWVYYIQTLMDKNKSFCGFLSLHYIQMCLQTILILERNKVVGFVEKLTRTEHHKTRSNGNQTVEIISIFPLILNKRNYFHVLFQFDSIFVEWTAQKNQQEKN